MQDFVLEIMTPEKVRAICLSITTPDFAPVTAARPARPGEVLVLQVRAAWPTGPALAPSAMFAEESFRQVAIPVEAVVNGAPAEISSQFAWPGTADRLRVDVRIPVK